MAIAPYRTSTEMFRPLFEDFFGTMGDNGRLGGLMRAPAADVVETETDIRVAVEMPGINPRDIIVDIENNVLSITGEKHEARTEGDERSTWHLTERRYGQFSRSFVLPRDVDPDGIRASFENGILTVSIPKSERARRRRIEVAADRDRKQVETGNQ
jgi:HSP20 family protein